MSFPNKQDRQKCWDARDRYWECLDGTKDDSEKCKEIRKMYETSCPSQWVKHFDRKRSYLKFKDKIQNEGIPSPPPQIYVGCPSLEPIVRRHRVYRQVVMT